VHGGCIQIFNALIQEPRFTNLVIFIFYDFKSSKLDALMEKNWNSSLVQVFRLLYNLSRDLDLRLKISETNVVSILLQVHIFCKYVCTMYTWHSQFISLNFTWSRKLLVKRKKIYPKRCMLCLSTWLAYLKQLRYELSEEKMAHLFTVWMKLDGLFV
jgi:hypothetical protein